LGIVTERLYPLSWTAEANTYFIGKIVLWYDIQSVKQGIRFTWTAINLGRQKLPTEDVIRHIDEEVATSVAIIKSNVGGRSA